MFYIKTRKPNGKVVRTEITDENTFTRCLECGRELPVDLAEILLDAEGDLFSTGIVCAGCTVKKTKPHMEAKGKVPLTYDGIVWLINILAHSGYIKDLLGLYDLFDINESVDLNPCEYAKFGKALAEIVIKAGEDKASGYEERRGIH